MRLRSAALAIVLAAAMAAPATAKRFLDVLPSVTWNHAATGLSMPPSLGPLPRNEVGDFGTAETDLFLQYRSSDDATEATIYVFHPGLDSVPVWFDRIQAIVHARADFGKAGEGAPQAFAVRPGGPAAGLRIALPLTGGSQRSTGVAVAPVGDWLVVVRLSSSALDAASLDGVLTAVLNGIGWPTDKTGAAPAAMPVRPCASLPSFHKGKLLKPDMAQALMGAIVGAAADDKGKAAPPVYCRAQQAADGNWGVYQVEGSGPGYVLALEDAGRAIGVQPSIAGFITKSSKPAFTLTLMDLTEMRNYGDVSALLPPEQALDLVNHNAPISAVNTLGDKKNIRLSGDVAEKK